jgi:hypothetical protein
MPVRAKHWATDDGRKFDDRGQATRHERWLEWVGEIRSVLLDADLFEPTDEANGTIDRGAVAYVARALLERRPELRRILRANPIEGGELPGDGGDDGEE